MFKITLIVSYLATRRRAMTKLPDAGDPCFGATFNIWKQKIFSFFHLLQSEMPSAVRTLPDLNAFSVDIHLIGQFKFQVHRRYTRKFYINPKGSEEHRIFKMEKHVSFSSSPSRRVIRRFFGKYNHMPVQ